MDRKSLRDQLTECEKQLYHLIGLASAIPHITNSTLSDDNQHGLEALANEVIEQLHEVHHKVELACKSLDEKS